MSGVRNEPPDRALLTEGWTLVDDFPGWSGLTIQQKALLADLLVAEFWRGYAFREDQGSGATLLRRPNLGPSPCGDPTCQCPDPCDSMECECPE